MFPGEFIARLSGQEYLDSESLLRALQEPSPVSIRVNPLKWEGTPAGSEPVPWCRSGYYLGRRPSFTLDPLFHAGCYYPQEASGMFLEQVFKQVADTSGYLRVLDLCGAPGGKSTHVSSLIGPESLLVSNEVIRHRSEILAENITRWGTANTVVTRNDPSAFSRLPDFFDLILVDAPCSGEGMFRDRIAVTEWSVGNTLLCAERQRRILADVWPALKPGGILIYSTCTFNPGENEENVLWLAGSEEAESVSLDISGFEGITVISNGRITGYGFHPGKIRGEGLFVSVIRKTGGSGGRTPSGKKPKGNEISGPDREVAGRWTSFNSENLVRKGEDIYYIPGRPADYFALDTSLTVIMPGTKIGSAKRNGYIPAHELSLSGGMKAGAFPVADLDLKQALAWLRKDMMDGIEVPLGWFVASYRGARLGFGNNIGNRINNYYPVGQRIRMNIPDEAENSIIRWENTEK
ncbi:MAG: rRNA cytosine-C5-methyltransferase [Bacteroidales bacterium]|nr:rRNA cytosine-C5-methyltransferase [Bacteroidales bacterium]